MAATKDGPFLILELVDGPSLHDQLKVGPLALERAIEITCQLCDGLSLAHERGIIHRTVQICRNMLLSL